jgi:hypothetical protein
MSRLNSAFSIIKGVVTSAIESPRGTIDALKLLPAVAQGLQFGRRGKFPPPPEGTAAEINPLRAYFDAHTEGPGIWKSHHYFDIYHRHFQKFIGREVSVLEVGIYSGGSLGMWLEYFGKNCHIYGMDIEKACMAYKSDRVDVFIGDQSDRSFWKRFREEVPKVDILIDDGGHDPEQQRITLEEMLPHIQPGGIYLCEDIGCKANRFGGYVSGLACHMNDANRIADVFGAPIQPSSFQAAVKSVIQYPYVTVIEKHEHNHGLFVTTKQGTEWQPY